MDNILYFNTITQPKGIMNNFFLAIPVLIFVVIFVGLIILISGTIYSMKNTSILLTDKEVIIKTMFYGKKIPLENILLDDIKSINLNTNKEYNISIRKIGTRLPGFASGWMKLKNGEKAWVYLTDKNEVLLLPTKDFVVLFSMDNIDEFISKIKEI